MNRLDWQTLPGRFHVNAPLLEGEGEGAKRAPPFEPQLQRYLGPFSPTPLKNQKVSDCAISRLHHAWGHRVVPCIPSRSHVKASLNLYSNSLRLRHTLIIISNYSLVKQAAYNRSYSKTQMGGKIKTTDEFSFHSNYKTQPRTNKEHLAYESLSTRTRFTNAISHTALLCTRASRRKTYEAI